MQPTLLVPLDGMPLAETALPFASLLSETLTADLDLLRVVEPSDSATMEARADAYLDGVAATLEPAQRVRTRVLRGRVGACIVREASTPGVALVVMTTHARSGLRRVVLGSVASYVVAHCRTQIVLIRAGLRPAQRLQTILVPVDGTGVAPLQTTMRLARSAGARVVLLKVVAPEETWIWQWQPAPVLDECQVAAASRQVLSDLAASLQAQGVPTQVRVEIGAPVETIDRVATATDSDLIVMATHARSGAERAIVGSVADAVLRTARQPVLLCRLPHLPRARGIMTKACTSSAWSQPV